MVVLAIAFICRQVYLESSADVRQRCRLAFAICKMAGAVFADSRHWLANTRRNTPHSDRPPRMMKLAASQTLAFDKAGYLQYSVPARAGSFEGCEKSLPQYMLSISAASGHVESRITIKRALVSGHLLQSE